MSKSCAPSCVKSSSLTRAEVLERNQWADSALIGEDFAANLEEERAIVDDIWAQLGY